MKIETTQAFKNRDNERGAAMVMALLMSFLLVAASAGVLLSTSMNSANVTDITAEQQAYAAAESGIQSVVNVLRYKCTQAIEDSTGCKVKPAPLLDTTKPAYHKANTITYVRALTNVTSNDPTDTVADPRMSRWMSYAGNTTADHVVYSSAQNHAYSVSVSDPDHTGSVVSFGTFGRFYDHDAVMPNRITYGTAPNTVVITYTPNSVSNLDISGASEAATNYGRIDVVVNGTGAEIPTLNRFEITVNMTRPYYASQKIRGFILQNTGSISTPPRIIFDSETYTLRGSQIDLEMTGFTFRGTGTRPFGYEVATGRAAYDITGTISAPEPDRLLVKSTGYGPRGARKELEAIVQSNYFSGLGAPATITMVGNATGPNGSFLFDPGASNAMLYSGIDQATGSSDVIPPIGVTTNVPFGDDDPNLQHVLDAVDGHIANNVQGVPSNVRQEIPPWMLNPVTMDATIKSIYDTALNTYDPANPAGTGRVFTNAQPTSYGDNANGSGITFCDGDCELGPVAGGGLLIVTGQLTLRGNFSFNGLIVVTGGGGILRSGGGTGEIEGNIIVAPYENSMVAGNLNPPAGSDFWAPRWETSGGGNSDIRYNSNNQANSLNAISNVVLGVVEK
ncbi:MAG: hypothetical protein PSX80_00860 [bacterium]|nr:hypothetical protein [bacterium]